MSSLKIELTTDLQKQLNQFAEDLQGKVLKSAMAAGARVLYDELLLRVPVADGILKSSVYRYLDLETINGPLKTYFIGVNMAEAKHWWLVEYGHMQTYQSFLTKDGKWVTLKNKPLKEPRFVPGTPYLRPTVTAKLDLALETVMKSMAQKIRENQA